MAKKFKKFKKIIAIFLTLAMILSMSGMTVLADAGITIPEGNKVTSEEESESGKTDEELINDFISKIDTFSSTYCSKNFMKPTGHTNIEKALEAFNAFKPLYDEYINLNEACKKSVTAEWAKFITSTTNGTSFKSRLTNYFKDQYNWSGNGGHYVFVTFSKNGAYFKEEHIKADSLTIEDLQNKCPEITEKNVTYVFDYVHMYGETTPITESIDLSGAVDELVPACVVIEMKVKGSEISQSVQAYLDAVAQLNGKTGTEITADMLTACENAYDSLSEDEKGREDVKAAKGKYDNAKADFDAQSQVSPEPSEAVQAYLNAVENLNGKDATEITEDMLTACEGAYNSLSDEEKKREDVKAAKEEYDNAKADFDAQSQVSPEPSEAVQTYLDAVAALGGVELTDERIENLLTACEDAYAALTEDAKTNEDVVTAKATHDAVKNAYANSASYSLNIYYKDIEGNDIQAAIHNIGKSGAGYDQRNPATIKGYTYDHSKGDKLKGQMTKNIIITHIYSKNPEKPARDIEGNGWSFDAKTGTLTITTTTGLSFYNNFTKEVDSKFVKNVFVDLQTPADVTVNNWSGIIQLEALESLTIKNAKKVTGPNTALTSTAFKTLTYENCDTLDTHKNLAFAEGGKVVIRNCTTINKWAFQSGTTGSYALAHPIPGLTEVEIENVKTIDRGAFCADNLKKVSIMFTNPDLKGSIKRWSFYNNPALEELYLDLAGCAELDTQAFSNTGSSNTTVNVVNYDPENTKYGESSLFDICAGGNPFKQEGAIDVVGLLADTFHLRHLNARQNLGERQEYTSSKVGTNGDTQVTKSASWINDDRTEAEVAFQFTYDEKPGRDYLFLMDISKSIGDLAAGYDHSRLVNFQSKVIDVADELLTANNFNNRVGIITFGSETVNVMNGTDGAFIGGENSKAVENSEAVKNYVLNIGIPDDTSTYYKEMFSRALGVINDRTDKTREVEIIFLSDGVVSANNDYQAELNALKDTGANIYVVVAGTAKTSGNNLTSLLNIASKVENVDFETYDGSLFYEATNTKGFSEAMNAAVNASFTEYVLTDNVDPRFTVALEDIQVDNGTAEITENADGSQTITWHIYGIPFEVYNLSYTATLKSPSSTYGYDITTNAGNATIYDIGEDGPANAVSSPELDRPAPTTPDPVSYSVTVNYVDEEGNPIQDPDITNGYAEGSSYTVTAPPISGYTFDHANGSMSGTIEGDVVVTLVYTRNTEINDPGTPPTTGTPDDPDTPPTTGTPDEPDTPPTTGTPDDPNTPDTPDDPSTEIDDPDTPTTGTPDDPSNNTEIDDPDTPKSETPATNSNSTPSSSTVTRTVTVYETNTPLASSSSTTENIEDTAVPLGDSPKTGDNSPLVLWTVLLLGSILSMAAIHMYMEIKRRGQRRRK